MSTKQTKNGAARGLPPAVRKQDAESKRRRKLVEVRKALACDPVDVAALRRSAISEGGLLTNELRRDVWPKLLSIDAHALPLTPGKDLRENNKDYNQVLLDVRRSLRRFPAGMQDDQRAVLQEQLIDVILHVLRRNPQLHYYQGYHDIVVTFLLVVGDHMATAMVDKLSTHHLRDFMDPTMDSTKHILNYLMPILERVNPELHDFMQSAEVGTIFALSWLITWYGHVLSDFRHVVRLYDFFLACHPLMPIYFAAVIVLHREEEVLASDCDMPSVHHLLSQIPQDLPYETLISRAGDLFVQFPPSELAKEASLQFHQSTAISTFKDFELASTQQRPDNVLRHRRAAASPAGGAEGGGTGPVADVVQGPSRMLKLAVWGLTATLGAAAIAAVNTALEWVPEFVLRLFP
uniref:TBC1 domain family member 20 n=1 Tax=Petromyzon marinus TaxID=7757 RepID=A0AAJ7U5R2_PETMA|nr:TBC1 domain family member 20 [Petromyzon marinus]